MSRKLVPSLDTYRTPTGHTLKSSADFLGRHMLHVAIYRMKQISVDTVSKQHTILSKKAGSHSSSVTLDIPLKPFTSCNFATNNPFAGL